MMIKSPFMVKMFKINSPRSTSSWLEQVPLDVNLLRHMLSWVLAVQLKERFIVPIMIILKFPT